MSLDDDPAAAARVEEILAKVDREVARRQASEAAVERAAPPPAAPPAAASPEAPAAPAARNVAAAATDPSRTISLAVNADGTVTPPRPTTLADLASGVAAARRRLAILTTQLDELDARVAALAAMTLGGPALGGSRPAAPPSEPPAPAAPELSASGLIAPPAAAEPPAVAFPPAAEPPAAPLPPAGAGAGAGMSIRPRPPAQHDRHVSDADRARLVAVELAVAGHPRGDVARVLRAEHGLADPDAMLDSLYGAGSGDDARMPGAERR